MVNAGGKWGYVEKTGKQRIKPQFSSAFSFKNGYAAVEIFGKWGYIDQQGQQAYPKHDDLEAPVGGNR